MYTIANWTEVNEFGVRCNGNGRKENGKILCFPSLWIPSATAIYGKAMALNFFHFLFIRVKYWVWEKCAFFPTFPRQFETIHKPYRWLVASKSLSNMFSQCLNCVAYCWNLIRFTSSPISITSWIYSLVSHYIPL